MYEGVPASIVGGCRAALQMQRVIRHGREEGAVVRDQQDRFVGIVQVALQPSRGVEIEMVGRLVENEEIGWCHELRRERQPTPFTARERLDRPGACFVVIEPQPRQDGVDPGGGGVPAGVFETLLVWRIPVEHRAGHRLAGGAHGIELPLQIALQREEIGETRGGCRPYGLRPRELPVLIHDGDPQSRRARYRAGIRLAEALNHVHQGRLAAGVPAHDAPAVALLHDERHPLEQRDTAEPDRHVTHRENCHTTSAGRP